MVRGCFIRLLSTPTKHLRAWIIPGFRLGGRNDESIRINAFSVIVAYAAIQNELVIPKARKFSVYRFRLLFAFDSRGLDYFAHFAISSAQRCQLPARVCGYGHPETGGLEHGR